MVGPESSATDDPMRLVSILVTLALVGLINLAVWGLPNTPVSLEPLPGDKLTSVSFAPFRDGQSPLTEVFPTAQQIEEDLVALAPQVQGVRTYTSLEGLEVVPELARRHGLKVTMGAWLSSRLDKNEDELKSLIDLANRYPDVITKVIVGNEVLLRRELTVDQVTAYIDRVQAAVSQPVSYADVWEWWLKYPEIADHVDYLTIHLLPYWEDVPAGITDATERIRTSYHIIAERFPGKPILIGETGWPTKGRSRGAASPGLVNKALFVNAFVRLAEQEGFEYNVIEAFNQGWKAKLEGTVGGHWGLYGSDRQPKFSLAGPVVENSVWKTHFIISTALAVVLLAGLSFAGPALGGGAFAGLAILTQALSTLLVQASLIALHGKHYWSDLALSSGMMALSVILIACSLLAARQGLSGIHQPVAPLVARFGRASAATLAAVAVVWSFLIILDGRYRDFPNMWFLIPAVALLGLGLMRLEGPGSPFALSRIFAMSPDRRQLERFIGYALLLGGFLTVAAEGVVPMESLIYGQLPFMEALHEVKWSEPNIEALAWAAIQLLLAIPLIVRTGSNGRRDYGLT